MSTTEFIKDQEYIFTAMISAFYPEKNIKQNSDGYFILGKFLGYKDIPYQNDIYIDGRADFEYGYVNMGHYDSVKFSGSGSGNIKLNL
jgi:hypothetical protein